MKNETFRKSIKCAFSGMFYACKTEKNFKYYFLIDIMFLILNIYFHVGLVGHLAYVITSVGVYASEHINTSMEHLVDMYSKEIRPDIKVVKDIAAGTVLCWGIGFFLSEIIMIGYSFL